METAARTLALRLLREAVPFPGRGDYAVCIAEGCAVRAVVMGEVRRMPVQLSVRGLAWVEPVVLTCGCCGSELYRVEVSPELEKDWAMHGGRAVA